MSLLVGLVTCELHLPHCRSLKEKRKVVKSLVDRIHSRYRVSVLESDFHDLHQRAELTVAILGLADQTIDKMMQNLRQTADQSDALVTRWDERVLEGRL